MSTIIIRCTEQVIYLLLGLLPQLMGVAPEKAIKLTTNFTVRDLLTAHMKTFLADEDGYTGTLGLFTAAFVAGIVSLGNWEHCLI